MFAWRQLGKQRSGRWILAEISTDTGHDRLRHLLLMSGGFEFSLLPRVGDECGFHQYRRNIGGFKHHETGLLNLALVGLTHLFQAPEYLSCNLMTHLPGRRLREIEQHRGQHIVFVFQLDTTHQIGAVLPLSEPACGFTGGATIGERVNR